ncbi:MAG: DEAD/DEAH box helicase family protein [Candidatus Comchoanobacterales bacterium]
MNDVIKILSLFLFDDSLNEFCDESVPPYDKVLDVLVELLESVKVDIRTDIKYMIDRAKLIRECYRSKKAIPDKNGLFWLPISIKRNLGNNHLVILHVQPKENKMIILNVGYGATLNVDSSKHFDSLKVSFKCYQLLSFELSKKLSNAMTKLDARSFYDFDAFEKELMSLLNARKIGDKKSPRSQQHSGTCTVKSTMLALRYEHRTRAAKMIQPYIKIACINYYLNAKFEFKNMMLLDQHDAFVQLLGCRKVLSNLLLRLDKIGVKRESSISMISDIQHRLNNRLNQLQQLRCGDALLNFKDIKGHFPGENLKNNIASADELWSEFINKNNWIDRYTYFMKQVYANTHPVMVYMARELMMAFTSVDTVIEIYQLNQEKIKELSRNLIKIERRNKGFYWNNVNNTLTHATATMMDAIYHLSSLLYLSLDESGLLKPLLNYYYLCYFHKQGSSVSPNDLTYAYRFANQMILSLGIQNERWRKCCHDLISSFGGIQQKQIKVLSDTKTYSRSNFSPEQHINSYLIDTSLYSSKNRKFIPFQIKSVIFNWSIVFKGVSDCYSKDKLPPRAERLNQVNTPNTFRWGGNLPLLFDSKPNYFAVIATQGGLGVGEGATHERWTSQDLPNKSEQWLHWLRAMHQEEIYWLKWRAVIDHFHRIYSLPEQFQVPGGDPEDKRCPQRHVLRFLAVTFDYQLMHLQPKVEESVVFLSEIHSNSRLGNAIKYRSLWRCELIWEMTYSILTYLSNQYKSTVDVDQWLMSGKNGLSIVADDIDFNYARARWLMGLRMVAKPAHYGPLELAITEHILALKNDVFRDFLISDYTVSKCEKIREYTFEPLYETHLKGKFSYANEGIIKLDNKVIISKLKCHKPNIFSLPPFSRSHYETIYQMIFTRDQLSEVRFEEESEVIKISFNTERYELYANGLYFLHDNHSYRYREEQRNEKDFLVFFRENYVLFLFKHSRFIVLRDHDNSYCYWHHNTNKWLGSTSQFTAKQCRLVNMLIRQDYIFAVMDFETGPKMIIPKIGLIINSHQNSYSIEGLTGWEVTDSQPRWLNGLGFGNWLVIHRKKFFPHWALLINNDQGLYKILYCDEKGLIDTTPQKSHWFIHSLLNQKQINKFKFHEDVNCAVKGSKKIEHKVTFSQKYCRYLYVLKLIKHQSLYIDEKDKGLFQQYLDDYASEKHFLIQTFYHSINQVLGNKTSIKRMKNIPTPLIDELVIYHPLKDAKKRFKLSHRSKKKTLKNAFLPLKLNDLPLKITNGQKGTACLQTVEEGFQDAQAQHQHNQKHYDLFLEQLKKHKEAWSATLSEQHEKWTKSARNQLLEIMQFLKYHRWLIDHLSGYYPPYFHEDYDTLWHVFQYDDSKVSSKLMINEKDVPALRYLVCGYLWLKTEIKYCEDIQQALKEQKQKNLYDLVYHQRAYNAYEFKFYPLLLLSYYKGFRLRPVQVLMYQDMLKPGNVVVVEQGKGKTTILLAIIARALQQYSDKHCVIVVHQALYQTQVNELSKELMNIYGLKSFHFENLIQRYQRMENIQRFHTPIFTTRESLQRIELMVLRMEYDKYIGEYAHYKDLYQTFFPNMFMIMDEMPWVLDPTISTIIPLNQRHRVEDKKIKFMVDCFRWLLKNNLIQSITSGNVIDTPHGLRVREHDLIERYHLNILPIIQKTWLAQKKKHKPWISTKEHIKLKQVLAKQKLTLAEREAISQRNDRCSWFVDLLYNLLPSTVNLIYNQSYGPGDDPVIMIPYREGEPTTLQFTSVMQQVVLSILAAHREPLKLTQFATFSEKLILKHLHCLNIMPQFQHLSMLNKLFNRDVFKSSFKFVHYPLKRKQIIQSWYQLLIKYSLGHDKNKLYFYRQVFDAVLIDQLLGKFYDTGDHYEADPENMRFHSILPACLAGSAQKHLSLSYQQKLYPGLSSTGRLVWRLTQLERDNRLTIETQQALDDFDFVDQASAIVDGAFMMTATNIPQHAKKLLSKLRNKDYLLFWHEYLPKLWLKHSNELKILSDVSPSTLKAEGVDDPKRLFIWFDQARGGGTNVVMPESAHFWITVNERTTLNQFHQNWGRARMTDYGQSITLVLSFGLEKKLNAYNKNRDINVKDLCLYLEAMDQKRQVRTITLTVFQRLRHIFRQALIKRWLEGGLFQKLREVLCQELTKKHDLLISRKDILTFDKIKKSLSIWQKHIDTKAFTQEIDDCLSIIETYKVDEDPQTSQRIKTTLTLKVKEQLTINHKLHQNTSYFLSDLPLKNWGVNRLNKNPLLDNSFVLISNNALNRLNDSIKGIIPTLKIAINQHSQKKPNTVVLIHESEKTIPSYFKIMCLMDLTPKDICGTWDHVLEAWLMGGLFEKVINFYIENPAHKTDQLFNKKWQMIITTIYPSWTGYNDIYQQFDSIQMMNNAANTIKAGFLNLLRKHYYQLQQYPLMVVDKPKDVNNIMALRYVIKKSLMPLIKIQSLIRQYIDQRRYINQKFIIIRHQKNIKSWFKNRTSHAVNIQSLWRRFFLRKALTKIQSLWRGFYVRKTLQLLNKIAIKVQSLWRGFYKQLLNKSATKVQSLWRGFYIRKNHKLGGWGVKLAMTILLTLILVSSYFIPGIHYRLFIFASCMALFLVTSLYRLVYDYSIKQPKVTPLSSDGLNEVVCEGQYDHQTTFDPPCQNPKVFEKVALKRNSLSHNSSLFIVKY